MRTDFEKKSENVLWYMSQMHPLFFKKAVFSDTTGNYVSPAEPDPFSEVTISIRTAKNNVDRVFLITEKETYPMKVTKSDNYFDYHSCKIFLNDGEINYYFRLEIGKSFCFYDATGITRNDRPDVLFSIIPGFHTPDWAKGAVMYQIYTERFCNGDPSNDVENGEYFYVGGRTVKVDDWYKIPAVDGTKEFYGGDIQGIINKLDYLADLGIEAIYLNPMFVSPSNHKYDSQDYEHIDPHFGKIVKDGGECLQEGDYNNKNATKYQIRVSSSENLTASDELFRILVEKAHEKGIRVILDGVFNHCGSFNKWLDRERIYEDNPEFPKGAYISGESPYRNYFDFRNGEAWPYNGSYDGWWGYDTLPKLNYEASEELYDKIISIAVKWVSPPFNVDGWRLDVAADLGHSSEFNHSFYKRLRKAVKEANPTALILAEHYGDPKPWLNGKEWDSVMNYDAFMEPVTWFLTGMQKHSDDFRPDMLGNAEAFFGTMRYSGNRFSNPSKLTAMNQLSNHDHSRFLTRTNMKVGRTNTLGWQAADEGVNKPVMRLAVLMQMTWIGAPTIYYGDEAGLTGFTDPDNRRTYPWGREDHELIAFHREMIAIHKNNRELVEGSLLRLVGEPYLVSYARFTAEDCTVVAINRSEEERMVNLPIWQVCDTKSKSAFVKQMLTTKDGYSKEVVEYDIEGANLRITLPPVSGIVLRAK